MKRLMVPLVAGLFACGGGATNNLPDLGAVTPQPDMTLPKGEQFSVSLTPWTLAPGDEKIQCQYVPPDGKEKWIQKFTTDMAAGSHHLVVFRIKDLVGKPASGPTDCTQLDVPDGFDGFLPGAQQEHGEYAFPDGVAMKMESYHGLLFQSHYINASTTKSLTTSVKWTLDLVEKANVQQQGAMIFYSNFGLNIMPGVGTSGQTATKSCKVKSDIKLLTSTGHMHKHALTFDANIGTTNGSGGTALYHSDTWSEPPNTLHAFPGIDAKAGTEITWTCTYNNDTNAPLHFGNSAATDEMCIYISLFYPSADGGTDFCL